MVDARNWDCLRNARTLIVNIIHNVELASHLQWAYKVFRNDLHYGTVRCTN